MQDDRRRLLRSVPSILLASTFPSLLAGAANAAKSVQPAALLIPRTGDRAALGRSMERAAMLAQGIAKDSLVVFDTQGTPAGAAAAAKQAMRKRPSILIGPLLSDEVRPVIAIAGGEIPVVAFSNDAALIDSGAFLLGITAEQSVSAILGYARARGIRRVGVFTAATGWRSQMLAAARRTATEIGIDIAVLPEGTPLKPESLAAAAGGEAPDALLVATGDPLLAASRDLRGSGIQLLGAFDGLTYSPAAVESLDGAWLSAPDPSVFSDFSHNFEARNGTPPGIIAGLSYDAATIVAALRTAGGVDRSGLLRSNGFAGVSGTVRFRDNGSAVRDLAILTVRNGAYSVTDHSGIT